MPTISHDTLAEHLRIPPDYTDRSLYLYWGAAWEYVRAFTRKPWPETDPTVGLSSIDAPASVNAAVLLLVGDLHENREAQGLERLHGNPTVERLLWPHRAF